MPPKTEILIVEDDERFAQVLRIRLQAWKPTISITEADSIAQAQQLLSESPNRFALIILDQHLPDGGGSTLLEHPGMQDAAVLAVSADESPEIPSNAIKAGARYFLAKRQISEPLFIPLVEAMLERKRLEDEIAGEELRRSKLETIRILLATLRHEIHNPLGAVFGGTYLLRARGSLAEDQQEALRLIEESSQRIKHVIDRLCEAAELEEVVKGRERVFHVPGDVPWEEQKKAAEERARERARKRKRGQ